MYLSIIRVQVRVGVRVINIYRYPGYLAWNTQSCQVREEDQVRDYELRWIGSSRAMASEHSMQTLSRQLGVMVEGKARLEFSNVQRKTTYSSMLKW
jgi:hypothetical protein